MEDYLAQGLFVLGYIWIKGIYSYVFIETNVEMDTPANGLHPNPQPPITDAIYASTDKSKACARSDRT